MEPRAPMSGGPGCGVRARQGMDLGLEFRVEGYRTSDERSEVWMQRRKPGLYLSFQCCRFGMLARKVSHIRQARLMTKDPGQVLARAFGGFPLKDESANIAEKRAGAVQVHDTVTRLLIISVYDCLVARCCCP